MKLLVGTTTILAASLAAAGQAEGLQHPISGATMRLNNWLNDCLDGPKLSCPVGTVFFEDLRVLLSASESTPVRHSADYKDGPRSSDNEIRQLEALEGIRVATERIQAATEASKDTLTVVEKIGMGGAIAGCLGTLFTLIILLLTIFRR